MKKLLLLLLTTSYLLLNTSIALAQSAETPIATDSQKILEDTYKDILQKANLKQTEEVLGEKADRNLLVGYAGTISDIKQGVFTLDTNSQTIQVSFGTGTTIIKDNQPLKPELISIKDKALVIGNLSSPDILTAKRIVIYKETAAKYEKKIVFSPIVKVDSKKKTITIKINDKNQEVTLGKLIKFDLAALNLNQKIFGVLLISSNGTTTLIQGKII